MKNIKISPLMQLEIFETVFLHLLDYSSMRYKLLKIINSRERVEQAKLDLDLKKIEVEIKHNNMV